MKRANTLLASVTGRKPGGRVAESQDYHVARALDSSILIGVADGVTNCAYGGSVARWVMDRYLAVDPILKGNEGLHDALPVYLKDLYDLFKQEFVDMTDMLDSACTVCAACIDAGTVSFCWVGDSAGFVIRGGTRGANAHQFTRPDVDAPTGKLSDCFGNHAPCTFKIESTPIEEGDVIVVATDGAKLDPSILAETFRQHGFKQEWLNELAFYAQSARFHDDITIVVHQVQGC